MEIRQFRYFVRIADLGSFSRAAQALHIAQPALSQQVAQLEEELGQALLTRLPGGVKLTEAGSVFYRHAQRLLQQLAEVEGAVAHVAANPSGSVRVGLPQSTASHYALPLLAHLREHFPGIEVEFFDELSGHLLHGLNTGRLDIAVLVSDDDAALLNAVPLMDESLFLVSRAGMAPPGKSVSLKRLAALPLALPGQQHGVRAIIEHAVHSQGLRLANVTVLANSMSIMREAMLQGLAHCVMPWAAVDGGLARGELVAQPFTPALRRRVHVCTARDAQLSLAGQAVFESLLAQTRMRVKAGQWQGVVLLPP
ncbi:MAG: LysR family transcriptional regulator [Burkholderiales bacterium]|nr:LysR family transcriptional regulator [Burkholderiales bacterium]